MLFAALAAASFVQPTIAQLQDRTLMAGSGLNDAASP
jgi:hypothetical protein